LTWECFNRSMRGAPLLALLLHGASADTQTSQSGCTCFSACARTIDSPFVKMCTTSLANVASNQTCGTFNALRNAYWEACNSTSTESSTASSPAKPLTTFWGMWLHMCASAVGFVSAVYALVGLALVLLLARTARDLHPSAPIKNQLLAGLVRSPLMWLGFVLAGAAHALFPSASLASILSYMYLSMPYAIDASVAITLGFTVAAVALFFAWNRGGGGVRSNLHASVFE